MEVHSTVSKLCTYFGIFLVLLAPLSTGNYPLLDVDTNMRIVLVPYDTPVGSIIYRLKASDSDNNFPLAFEVLGSVGKSLLSLEFLGCSLTESLCQADVLLSKPLDEGRTYEFKLRVRDTTGDYTQVPAVITATTSSTNTNAVLGTKLLQVPENTRVGSLLDKFVVVKNDLNARVVVLELRDKHERIELKQRLLSNNRTEGTLYLKKPLDFETEPWFTVTILVMNAYTNTNVDTRNVLVSEIVVAVQDVQDTPPEFQILPAYVEIPKSIQKGDLITKVVAVDGDKQNKRLIRYGFLTDSNPFVSFFDLDPMSGEIFLKRDISQLSAMARPNEPIRMTIIADEIIPDTELNRFSRSAASSTQEPTSTKAVITFYLGPGVAVGPPRFSSELYATDIKEDSVIGTSLHFSQEPRIYYEGIDEVVALTFGFSSSSGGGRHNDSKPVFEFVPREGRGNFSFELRLLDTKLIDYEAVQQIKLQMIATSSSGLVGYSDLKVDIRDANDHSPVFSQKEYRVELPENAAIGTRVVQVHAVDRDSGNNGRVVYTSLVGSEAFRLDAVTGEITVDKSDILDRETEPEIRLYVEAKDGGYTDAASSIDGGFSSIRNIASATVIVTLIDNNDNPPVFSQKYYQVILTPDATALKYPVRITADDDDSDGPNSLVRYQLSPDSPRQFTIDQMTGELKLRSQYKPDVHNQDGLYLGSLKVRAYDSGSPQLHAETTVQIFSKEVLSRQIQFVLPTKLDLIDNNRKRFEDMLSSLTGGTASIKDTRILLPSRTQQGQSTALANPHQLTSLGQPKALSDNSGEEPIQTIPGHPNSPNNQNSNANNQQMQQQNQQQPGQNTGQNAAARGIPIEKTLVIAEVTYPISASPPVVDLDAFTRTYMVNGELNNGGNGDGVTRNSTTERQIEMFRAENQILFWLLIAFILLLLLLFLLFLCCIFCPCCYLYTYCKRYDKRRDVIQELDVDKRGTDRRRNKTYPSRIEEEAEGYDNDNNPNGYPTRREAWSGADNGRGRRGAPGPGQGPGPIRRHGGQQPGGRGNVEGDVALEDWEFNEHGNPLRNAQGAEEIGPRWQQQQQQNRQVMNMVTDGFASRRPPGQQQQQQVQQHNNPNNNNMGDVDRSSEPGNNTYLMQRLNHLPPGARPYPSNANNPNYNNNYPVPPQSQSHSLPPNEAQMRAQTRPTRFYRTEAGEVLQLDDYEGDEGKEMLMRRFINEQEPQNDQHQQQQPGPHHMYEKRRIRTPAAIATDVKGVQMPSRQPSEAKGLPSAEPTPANSTTTLAERPKAAVVSRRSREALEMRGEDRDVEYGIINDDGDDEGDGDGKKKGSVSPTPGASKEASKHRDRSKDKEKEDREGGGDGSKKRKEKDKHRDKDREKSRSLSQDSETLSPQTKAKLDLSKVKHKSKSKSKSKSRSRSKSPLIKSKSKHHRRSHSKSRSRSRSRSGSRSPTRSRSGSKEKRESQERHVRKSQQKKVPKSRKSIDEENKEERDKEAVAAVTAAAAALVAKRKAGGTADGQGGGHRQGQMSSTTNNNIHSTTISSTSNNIQNTTTNNQIVGEHGQQQYYDGQFQEEDGDSGIGIVSTSKRHNMLEKKSVFTIAYDEMASQKVLRPDTSGIRPGTMEGAL